MTNTKLLRERINASGLKIKYLADSLFITPKTLSMKIDNRYAFKAPEIAALCRILKIDPEEKELIFFNMK